MTTLPGGLSARYYAFHFLIGLLFSAVFLLIGLHLMNDRLIINLSLKVFAVATTVVYPYAHVLFDRMNFSSGSGTSNASGSNSATEDSSMDLVSFIVGILFLYVLARFLTWVVAIPALPFAIRSLRNLPMTEGGAKEQSAD